MDSSLQSVSKKFSRKLKKLGPFSVFIAGLLIFAFGAFNYYRIRILSFSKIPSAVTSSLIGELPVNITIPSIGIDLPIDVGTIKDGVWQISYSRPTFLDTSSRPGTGGNIVIYGHNKKTIFGNLPYLSLGQKIFVKTYDGKIHPYTVTEKLFVSPYRVDLVSPGSKEELTIYTCWGLFDSQRVVIKARSLP